MTTRTLHLITFGTSWAGVNIFVSGIQDYVAGLAANQTNLLDGLAKVRAEVGSMKPLVGGIGALSQQLLANVSAHHVDFVAATKSSDDVLKTVQTLKSNVIGLGNYINSINRELHALSETTGKSVETINKKVAVLTR